MNKFEVGDQVSIGLYVGMVTEVHTKSIVVKFPKWSLGLSDVAITFHYFDMLDKLPSQE